LKLDTKDHSIGDMTTDKSLQQALRDQCKSLQDGLIVTLKEELVKKNYVITLT
jgi:hypothetical protein